jgi:hypothetical protein
MNSSSHVTRYIRISLVFIAVLLLLVNIAGIFLHPSFNTSASIQKKGTPGYHYPVSDKTILLEALKEKGDTKDTSFVDSTTQKVFYSMFHSEERRITIYENWMMWLAGKIYPPAGRTQDAELLVKGGAGNCSERTQVLMDIFKLNGLNCRIISLNGHIAQQVFFNGRWMVTDADYGLVYKGDMQQMESEAGLAYADSVLAVSGFNADMRNKYLYFWKTGNDNGLSPVNKVSSTRLFQAEKTTQWLKWIIPLLILIICIMPLKKKNYNNHS